MKKILLPFLWISYLLLIIGLILIMPAALLHYYIYGEGIFSDNDNFHIGM